jgi:sugar/nucleoside kinase (ribokinase family)
MNSKGAGDAFVGAFVHYLNHLGENELFKVIELASEYASITVQYPGTQTSYLTIDELDSKFKLN